MWLPTSIIVLFVLCLECSIPLNVGASEAELTSLLLSRVSQWECASNTDCTIANSSCTNGYCECDGGYIYNTDMTACLLAATAHGDECVETIQCSTYLLTGSVCANGICTCNDGYHYTRGRCYASAALGEACTTDVNCYVWTNNEASSCVNGICECSDGFYPREYRTCRRASYSEGDSCAIDHDCQFENAYCSGSSIDANGYVCAVRDITTTTTITPNNDIYETEDEVYGKSRVVRSLARADANATVGTECVSDEHCTTLANSRCGAAGYCICERAYYASDDLSTCISEIGGDCSIDDDVEITNSLCLDGTWSCGHSSVASINQQICRKSTKNYNFSCLHDEQCDIFGPDASCQNKRCLCNERSHLVEDLKFCWVSKGISESCQADEDCYVKDLDVELSCTNSVCTCPNGTSPNSDKTLCKGDNAELGETCEDDNDCINANSACIDSICACPEYYFAVDDYCAAGINATCSSATDCTVTNSECSENNVCECTKNYVSDATDSCLPVASYGENCESDIQCSTLLSNTHCSVVTTSSDDDSNPIVASSCECESDYHYRFGICNYKREIGKSCTSLGDCYVESGIEDVVCRKGICSCSWDASIDGTTSCSRTASDATTIFLSTWMSLILLSVKIFLV